MDKFSPKHFLFLILGVSIVSLKTYPTTFIRDGLRDTWIGVIISSIIIFIVFLYIIMIWKKKSDYNLIKIYREALGNNLGNIVIVLFMFTLFFTLIESASIEADSMHQNMLLETPKWYLLLFFVIPAIYTIKKDLVSIVTIAIIGIMLIIIAGINLSILTTKYKDVKLLFPIFEHGLTPGFFISILKSLGLYGSICITLPYLSKISDRKSRMTRYVVVALLFVIQMQILAISGILMTFTPDLAITMNYPKLLQTQQVSYLQFLEFGELYVMLQIVGGWLLKYIITFYSLVLLLRNFNIREKYISYSIYAVSLLVFICAYISSNNSFILFKLLNYYEFISLINFVIIPLIVFMRFNRKLKVQKIS